MRLFFHISPIKSGFRKYSTYFIFHILFVSVGYSQENKIIKKDTTNNQQEINDTINKHRSSKASAMSAILPGLGQVYNHKYWKVPVIYGALGALSYFAVFNYKKHNEFKNEYKYRSGDTTKIIKNHNLDIYTDKEELLLQFENYKRQGDLFVFGAVVVYILNIVDAAVDAHLYSFDVSDKLTLEIQPTINCSYQTNQTYAGFSLKIKL